MDFDLYFVSNHPLVTHTKAFPLSLRYETLNPTQSIGVEVLCLIRLCWLLLHTQLLLRGEQNALTAINDYIRSFLINVYVYNLRTMIVA